MNKAVLVICLGIFQAAFPETTFFLFGNKMQAYAFFGAAPALVEECLAGNGQACQSIIDILQEHEAHLMQVLHILHHTYNMPDPVWGDCSGSLLNRTENRLALVRELLQEMRKPCIIDKR